MKLENYNRALSTAVAEEFSTAIQQGCTRCSLSNLRSKPIIYRGNLAAPILLMGECPGKVEEETGEPFRGPAGELLDKIIAAIGLSTNRDMCISNVAFCRPAAAKGSGRQNYTPRKEQLVRCRPFVEKFISLVDPKIIIACGRTALAQLLDDDTVRLGAWEGRWTRRDDGIPIFTMRHPASLLHSKKFPQTYMDLRRKMWNYMQHFEQTWKEQAQ